MQTIISSFLFQPHRCHPFFAFSDQEGLGAGRWLEERSLWLGWYISSRSTQVSAGILVVSFGCCVRFGCSFIFVNLIPLDFIRQFLSLWGLGAGLCYVRSECHCLPLLVIPFHLFLRLSEWLSCFPDGNVTREFISPRRNFAVHQLVTCKGPIRSIRFLLIQLFKYHMEKNLRRVYLKAHLFSWLSIEDENGARLNFFLSSSPFFISSSF